MLSFHLSQTPFRKIHHPYTKLKIYETENNLTFFKRSSSSSSVIIIASAISDPDSSSEFYS